MIRQPNPITDRRFEIEFLDPDAEAFAFTFGRATAGATGRPEGDGRMPFEGL